MSKRLILIILALFLIAAALAGCEAEPETVKVSSEDAVFYFDKLNDVIFTVDVGEGEFVFIEGSNIASGDYSCADGILTIKSTFLLGLEDGKHSFTLYATNGEKDFELTVAEQGRKYKVVNGGFETGDLFGWEAVTVFKGEDSIQSFIDEGIKPNETFFAFEAPYNGDGAFVYGMDDRDGANKDLWNERMGILRSSVFELGGSGFVSFKLGGGKNTDLSYISVREAATDTEIARFGNYKFNSTSYLADPDNYFEANLVKYAADLRAHLGKKLFFEVCDYGGRDWDLLTIDSFETYLETEPEDCFAAIDIKPSFQAVYVTNTLPNASFADGLKYWSESKATAWTAGGAFRADNGILKSNLGGDAATGLIRSSLFRVDGSGIISLEIGAAQGARYDKDTYVSIKEALTNREIFRFANHVHTGTDMKRLYIDLSAHIGKNCYLEIVDNAKGSYDTVFVSDIITYYENTPAYDFGIAGRNLNY